MNAKYDRVAKQTGARVLSFTGFDSVPSDIGTMALSRKFAAKFGGKTPKYVDFIVTKMNAEAQVIHSFLFVSLLPPLFSSSTFFSHSI